MSEYGDEYETIQRSFWVIFYSNCMRIAHISDIHANTTPSFQSRFRNLLESVRERDVDHLIVTGDLTDKATSEEYDVVIDILNDFGFRDGKTVTVIPGNHDVFPMVYQSFTFRLSTLREEFRREPVRISKELYRVLRTYRKFGPEQYRNALQYFAARFKHTFDTALPIGGEETAGFPYVKSLNDQYAVVAIESNFVSPHIKMFLPYALLKYLITKDMFVATDSPICSNGWIDIDLLRKALVHPEIKEKRIIVLMHHYMYSKQQVTRYMSASFAKTMSIVNREQVIEELRNFNIELILHGHWHVTEEYPVCTGTLHALNGAGVLQKNDGKWNLLHLNAHGIMREEIKSEI